MSKIVQIGDLENYVGIRGYPKQRGPVFLANPDAPDAPKENVGVVKVEPILDKDGKLLATTVYARVRHDLMPKKGEAWQYASLRAITAAMQARYDAVKGPGLTAYEKSTNFVDLDATDAMTEAGGATKE
jgi:hypothetical protein